MWLMKGFSSGSDFLFAPFFDLKISLSCDLEAILGCGVSKYMYWEIYLDGRLGFGWNIAENPNFLGHCWVLVIQYRLIDCCANLEMSRVCVSS